jgi:hypothetical protein
LKVCHIPPLSEGILMVKERKKKTFSNGKLDFPFRFPDGYVLKYSQICKLFSVSLRGLPKCSVKAGKCNKYP